MAAILALICFVLALFGVHPAGLDLVILGLVFLAAHFIYPYAPWTRARP
jgi:hypothetical protein